MANSQSKTQQRSTAYLSQKATVESMSIFEKLAMIPALLIVVGNIFGAVFTFALRKNRRTNSFYKYVAMTAMRAFVKRTTVRQQHLVFPPTDDMYLSVSKKHGYTPSSVFLEDGTRANWIGDPKAEKIILNLHGGGYVLPASRQMVETMFHLTSYLSSKGKNVSCLFLSYDLAPGAHYPRQLQQAAMFLNYVVNTLHFQPQNIILTGDSAGGNLVMALLSHISHPHPPTSLRIPKVDLPAPLLGAVLVSPWTTFSISDDSVDRNKFKDAVGRGAVIKWSAAFMNSAWPHSPEISDYYIEAITAPEEWWNDLKVDRVLITAGGDEVLVDSIERFAGQLRRGFGEKKVDLEVVEGEYHDQINVDIKNGYKYDAKGARIIMEWLAARF